MTKEPPSGATQQHHIWPKHRQNVSNQYVPAIPQRLIPWPVICLATSKCLREVHECLALPGGGRLRKLEVLATSEHQVERSKEGPSRPLRIGVAISRK
ncbi:hypothetical protein R5576_05300 [Xanthomonas euvesicatoria]|nr:hypothetical protein R5576_15120 [Xanthomonas euvesicatoria]WOP53334.1 hypothetical protein R5576_05300 [Xanthomonas euvesicatoria]